MTPDAQSGMTSPWARQRSHAFLIRCWQEVDGNTSEAPAWRFSLTHIDNFRKVMGFVELEDVLAYLNQVLAEDEGNRQSRIHKDESWKENKK